MRIKLLNPLFYSGLLLLTIGTLVRIQHWEDGPVYQGIGLLLLLAFFFLVLIEVINSRKASGSFKGAVIALYTMVPAGAYYMLPAILLIFALLISGSVYLGILRKKVLFSNQELMDRDFDSI
jgi:hypothetical protein